MKTIKEFILERYLEQKYKSTCKCIIILNIFLVIFVNFPYTFLDCVGQGELYLNDYQVNKYKQTIEIVIE